MEYTELLPPKIKKIISVKGTPYAGSSFGQSVFYNAEVDLTFCMIEKYLDIDRVMQLHTKQFQLATYEQVNFFSCIRPVVSFFFGDAHGPIKDCWVLGKDGHLITYRRCGCDVNNNEVNPVFEFERWPSLFVYKGRLKDISEDRFIQHGASYTYDTKLNQYWRIWTFDIHSHRYEYHLLPTIEQLMQLVSLKDIPMFILDLSGHEVPTKDDNGKWMVRFDPFSVHPYPYPLGSDRYKLKLPLKFLEVTSLPKT